MNFKTRGNKTLTLGGVYRVLDNPFYYGCTGARDRDCKSQYIREEELIAELLKIFDQININELGMKTKLEDEIKRFSHFQRTVFGSDGRQEADEAEVNIWAYARYLLRQGSVSEKRELLWNLRSRLVYLNKKITPLEPPIHCVA